MAGRFDHFDDNPDAALESAARDLRQLYVDDQNIASCQVQEKPVKRIVLYTRKHCGNRYLREFRGYPVGLKLISTVVSDRG